VARELARRGIEVLGVDVDPSMIATARRLAPELDWVVADLSALELHRRFDLVVMAGNVLLFTPPGTEADLVRSCARHVDERGHLVAGFALDRSYDLNDYDRHCGRAGLVLEGRWATWEGEPWTGGGTYAVSAHRPGPAPTASTGST
jgi:SAM-dependent methyltransferase